MIYPAINNLVKKAGSRYSLAVAVAKRARELVDGDKPTISIPTNKPVSIAVNEIDRDEMVITEEAAKTVSLTEENGDLLLESIEALETGEDGCYAGR